MSKEEKMDAKQIELARHALGLPNKGRQSYRNRFSAAPGHADYATWMAMVGAGLADRQRSLRIGGLDFFYLTLDGALLALKRGEKLCPEDFPTP